MPTYDFRCPAGHDFERFFGRISSAPSEVECPTCGATATRQISGGAGLVFKGSGFYITDYGKDGKKDQKPAVKPDAAKGGESSTAAKGEGAGAKSDAAPAKSDAASSAAKPGASSTPATPSKPAGGE